MPEVKDIKIDTIFLGDESDYNFEEDNIKLTVDLLPIKDNSQVSTIIFSQDKNLTLNNVKIKQGELGILLRNVGGNYIDFEINEDGELIINGEEAHKYSLNEEMELIYTEDE